ncbi:MAG: hypothetical protein RI890_562, partial [Actinomycetota bacterium]
MDPHQRFVLETAFEALLQARETLASENQRAFGTFV